MTDRAEALRPWDALLAGQRRTCAGSRRPDDRGGCFLRAGLELVV